MTDPLHEYLICRLRTAHRDGDIEEFKRSAAELNERYERQRRDHIDELTARGFWSQ